MLWTEKKMFFEAKERCWTWPGVHSPHHHWHSPAPDRVDPRSGTKSVSPTKKNNIENWKKKKNTYAWQGRSVLTLGRTAYNKKNPFSLLWYAKKTPRTQQRKSSDKVLPEQHNWATFPVPTVIFCDEKTVQATQWHLSSLKQKLSWQSWCQKKTTYYKEGVFGVLQKNIAFRHNVSRLEKHRVRKCTIHTSKEGAEWWSQPQCTLLDV